MDKIYSINITRRMARDIGKIAILLLILVLFNQTVMGQASQLTPIGSTLTSITNCDDCSQNVSITSTFSGGIKFGANTYTTMWVGSNGYLTFGHSNSGYQPQGIPGYTAGPIIAGQYDDLGPHVSGDIYYSQNGDYLVVTYSAVAPYCLNPYVGSGYNTFQIVLRRPASYNGTTNFDFTIEVRYINMNWARSCNATAYPSAGWSTGTGTTYQVMPFSGLSTFLSNQTYNMGFGNGIFRWDVEGGIVQSAPTVNTTTSVTGISGSGGNSGGNVSADGGAAVTSRGVCYSTSQTPTISNGVAYAAAGGTGSFTATMTGLNSGTLYYVRAFATNSIGTGYGPQVQFNTSSQSAPTVSTTTATSITVNSASSGGNASSDGGAAISAKGLVWNTSGSPTISSYTGITNNGGSTGSFTSSMTSLANNTTYYYRAYATNSVGTSYGTQYSLLTLPTDPTSPVATPSTICNGSSSQLTVSNAQGTVYWYTGGCGTTYVGTGNPITVYPTTTTTYYARNYNSTGFSGGCTAGLTVTVNQPASQPASASVTVPAGVSGQTSANLSWGASTGLAPITYYWAVGTGSGVTYESGYTARGSASNPTVTATASGLTKSTNYYMAVKASNSCATSGYRTSSVFRTNHELIYTAGSNGTVGASSAGGSSSITQTVANNGSGTAVYAVPNANYHFINWSDGSTSNPRTDVNVTNSISVTANFGLNSLAFSVQPSNTIAGQNIVFTVRIKDVYGNTMTNSDQDVTIAIGTNPASGTLAGTLTLHTTNGVASSGNVWINKVGTGYTLTATASPLTGATSGAFDITPAAIDHFTVVGIADPVVAGTTTTPVVTAYDQYDNIKTNYTGTIVFSSDDPKPAVLPVNYTFLAGDHGVKTFTNGVTLKTTGERSVTVTGDTKTGTQDEITVTPAAINYFTLVANGTVIAGTPFTVTATVYDEFGNIKTNYDGPNNVTWTTTASSSFNGTARIIPANGVQEFTAGVATVGGFTFFNSHETPTITITDAPSSSPGTTTPIMVYNAPLDNFLVVAGTTQSAGVPFNITVTARDVYWNTCRDYVGNIRFKSSDDLLVTFPAGLQPFILADQGVRTFTNGITINTIGAYWVRAADAIYAYKSGEQQNIVVGPGPFSPLATDSWLTISDPLTPTTFVDPLDRIAGEYVWVIATPRDAYGNLLYACRDISILLNGAATDYDGNIVVTNVGDGSYTARVRVTLVGDNLITARFNDYEPDVMFDQVRHAIVAPAPPNYLAVTGNPTQTAGQSQLITFTAYDIFNNVATDYNGPYTLTLSGPNPSPAPSTWPTIGGVVINGLNTITRIFTNGICHSQTLTLYKVETAQITATDGAINANSHKLSVVVSHAATNYFTVAGSATQTAGEAQTITVSAFDMYNNPATGYEGSHDLVFSGAGSTAAMPPSPAFVPTAATVPFGTATTLAFNSSGVATASMVLYKVETAQITAADGAINGDAHKLDVDVSHNTPDFLAITGNSTMVAGSTQTITIKAYDHYNNLATGYAGTKDLTFAGANPSPTPGTNPRVNDVLFGNATSITFTLGEATGDMKLYNTETAHITATDLTINADDHRLDVVVTDAVHAYLKITGTGTQTAGVSQNITVTAYDEYNNVAVGYTGTKTLTFSGANPSPIPSTWPTIGGVIVDGTNTVDLTFINGVCSSVPMVLYNAETAHITAFDNTIPPINADLHKLTVVVSPAAGSYFAVTGTGTQVAGTSQTITVTAYDAFNNVATGYTGSHDLTFSGANPSPAPATNPKIAGVDFGSVTSMTFTAGVATGTMFLYKDETAEITATDGAINADLHKLTVVVSPAAGSYFAVTGTGTQVAGTSQTITVTAYDAFNNVATGYTGAHDLTFSGANPSPAPATNPTVAGVDFGSVTSMTFTAGVATGTMFLYKDETALITATDGVINANLHKLTVVVSPAAGSYFAVTGTGTQVAGTSQTITVTAYDAFNNVATGYTGAHDLTFSGANPSPAPASNPTVAGVDFGSVTSMTFTAGVSTGTMFLYKDETAEITATDGFINANLHKLTVVVSPAAESYFAVTGTGTQVAGTSQTITVTAYDAFNNVATGYTGAHNLTFSGANPSPVPATKPTVAGIDFGLATSLSFADGVATGTMFLYKAETAQITATDGAINADLHKLTVVVSPAAGSYFAVTGTGTQVAGTSQTITVTAYDAFNNVATGYTGAHSLTFTGANPSPVPATNPTVAGVDFGLATSLLFADGVATGTMFLYKVETALITATDGVINADLHKLTVVVSPAAGSYFAVTGTGTQVAGTSQIITVTAYDAFNNVATGYTGSHDLTFSGASESPTPSSYPTVSGFNFGVTTALSFTAGVATGTMFLYKDETAQITTTDGVINANLHKLTVVVSPAAGSYFAVTGTGTQVAGTSQTITVTAYDAYNNVATGYTGAHSLTFSGANPSPVPSTYPTIEGTVFGTTTSLSFTAGVATGTMFLFKDETALITATDGVINADLHKLTVVVSPAAESYFAVTGTGTQTAGDSQVITVTAYDAYNNVATGYTGVHNLTFSGANPSPAPATNPTVAGVDFGSATSMTFTAGVSTGTMFLYKVETALVNVSEGAINANAHKLTVEVSHALPNYFAITGSSTQMAGNSQTITVTTYDAFNNIATGYVGSKTVIFSGANPSPSGANPTIAGTAFGGATTMTFVAGVASASMTLYKTEIAEINVSEGAKNADLHKLTVTVTPTLLKDFIVYGVPDPHDLGTWQSVTVEPRDTYHNRKTNYTRKITFSNTDVSAINPADYTFTVADQGIHTFVNLLKFSQEGNWWLTAIDMLEPTKYGAQADITVQRAITITANDRSKIYGNEEVLGAMSISTCTVTGIVPGVNPVVGAITGITLSSAGAPATATVLGSPYAIVPSAATGPYNPAYYRIVYSDAGELTVNVRPLILSEFMADGKMYDGTTDVTGITFSDDRVNNDALTFSFVASFDDKHAGNDKPVSITNIAISGGAGATNYELMTTSGTAYADIDVRPINVTAQTDTKVYDGTNTSDELPVVDALQFGDVVTSVGTQTYDNSNIGTSKEMTATGAVIDDGNSGNNYDITYVHNNTGVITPRAITITANAGQTKVYGEADPIELFYTITAGSLAPLHSFDGDLIRVAGETVGNYAINKGSLTIIDGASVNQEANYAVTYVSNNFTITQRPITISVLAGQNKMYGEADPLPFAYSLTSGTLAFTDGFDGVLSRVAGETVGTYQITKNTLTIVEGSTNKEANYLVTYVPANFTIFNRPITITVNAGQTKTYGHADPLPFTYAISGSGLASGDQMSGALVRDAGETIGNYTINQGSLTIVDALLNSKIANYTVTYVSNTFSITKRPITITANSGQTKVYGALDPLPFTYTVTGEGLATGDVFDGVLSRVTGENVNSYAILKNTLTIVEGATNKENNYNVTYNGSDFTITKRTITVAVTVGLTKVYAEGDPTLTYNSSVSPLYFGGTFTGVLVRETGENVAADYEISRGTLQIADGNSLTSLDDNYNLIFFPANFSITKKPITITVNSGQNKVYGNADPELLFASSVAPLPFAGTFTGDLERAAGNNVATTYAITRGTLQINDVNSTTSLDNNYTLTFVGADFEITRRPITITANNRTKTYGDPITMGTSQFGITGDGMAYSETITSVDLASLGEPISAHIGPYAITTANAIGDNGYLVTNYTVTYSSAGTLTVGVRTLTLSNFGADSKIYDGTTVATGIGFDDNRIPGDNLAFTRDAAFETASVGVNKPVQYTNIVISGGSDMLNYVLASTTGTAYADIYVRAMTITANDVEKPYGTTLTSGAGKTEFFSSGLQNGETIGSVTLTYGSGAAALDAIGLYPDQITPSVATGGTFSASNYSITYATGDITVIPATKISGFVKYYNKNSDIPMNNVKVELQGTAYFDFTDATGYYEILNPTAGTYTVIVTTTEVPGEAVNASDAALANAWYIAENQFGQWPSIQKTKFFAGDVTGDTYVAPNDAQQMQAFYVGSWGTWSGHSSRADWTFWKKDENTIANPNADLYPTVTILPSSNLNQDFYGLITGDFERGYIPGAGKDASDKVRLNYSQTLGAGANEVISLPVYTQDPITVGAVSLILNFPSDKLEVMEVTMNDISSDPLSFNVIGNELRIGWHSMAPVYLAAGEQLLTVKVRLLGALSEGETLRFTLSGSDLNELADASYATVSGATIVMNQVAGSAWGINPVVNGGNLALANYPNPFTTSSTISYTLPYAGEVTIEVRNMLGSVVKTMVNKEKQNAGDYKISLDATSFAPGVYSATLNLNNGEGQPMTRTIMIVRKQ